jgi:hypothetical protein
MLRTVPGTGEYSKLLAIVIWYFYYYKQVSCEYSGTSSFFTVLVVLGFELRASHLPGTFLCEYIFGVAGSLNILPNVLFASSPNTF